MGLGLLGRGVGDARFLTEMGANLIVTDLKTEKELASSLKKLRSYKLQAITYVLGGHRLEDFRDRDLIIKAAGVPVDSPFVAEARQRGIPIEMSTALFARLSKAKIIGVTGTKGKTTVTRLIYEILKHCRGLSLPVSRTLLDSKIRKVWLGGNIQGVSTLALLKKVKKNDLVVLELDSWQLQGFGENKISPPIAVFTNFLPDHLNYYASTSLSTSMKRYFEDKANIYKFQRKEDVVFVVKEIAKQIKTSGRKIIPPVLPTSWKLNLIGKHNRINASLAAAAARELGVPDKIIRKALANFPGVPGRLELIKVLRGVKFYNDTTSTTPDALKAGLAAAGSGKKNIILIMGGADKNLEIKDEIIKMIKKYCKKIILLPGTGTNKLLKNYKLEAKSWREANTLREAVQMAIGEAKNDGVVLLSPGFASFGPPPGGFKNEFDRGEKFNRLVKKLK